jgi:LacI family transcriptional regulator
MFVGADHDPELYSLLTEFQRPYVLTWGIDGTGTHPSIGFDNRAAAYAMASHLVRLGHRRFGLITAPHQGNDRGRERSAGIVAALAAHGLRLDDSCVEFSAISLESGTEAMRRLLARPPWPSVVMATNDVLAVGAMLACREAGARIPDEISITGVDNTDLGATQTPPLTSIQTPIVEVGTAAGLQLIARLEGAPAELHQQLPFTLMKRGSTAKPGSSRKPAARRGRS